MGSTLPVRDYEDAKFLALRKNQVYINPREQGLPSLKWAYSSAGEHYVDIVGVTGSIPVPPTILPPPAEDSAARHRAEAMRPQTACGAAIKGARRCGT